MLATVENTSLGRMREKEGQLCSPCQGAGPGSGVLPGLPGRPCPVPGAEGTGATAEPVRAREEAAMPGEGKTSGEGAPRSWHEGRERHEEEPGGPAPAAVGGGDGWGGRAAFPSLQRPEQQLPETQPGVF